MSVVVDASVLVAALADSGPSGVWAESILGGGGLHAPQLIQVEATNVLRRLERIRQISRPEALAALEDLLQLDVELHPFAPFGERVWELRRSISSYDAWYVALAEAFDLPLATLDEKLARAPGIRCEVLLPDTRSVRSPWPEGG